MSITRRDFLNGVSIGIVAGLSPLDILGESAYADIDYYPPELTGLRGNHPGSYEIAHKVADDDKKDHFNDLKVEEIYDLVVVGGGISGLSAARFYQQKFGSSAKILIIDNHDDFGGHAKRNEFKVEDKLILSYGGTESLQAPKRVFSKTALDLLKDISVNIENLGSCFNQNFYPNLGLSRGVFFDKESFSEAKLVSGDPGRTVDDDIDPKQLNGRSIRDFINDFPYSEKDRKELISLHEKPTNYLPGMSVQERISYLSKTSYKDFLLKNVGLSEIAVNYFQGRTNDFFAFGIDGVSALDARVMALPGLDGMDLPPLEGADSAALNEPYIYHFPDGNASIARLLVRKLIPEVAPGNNMEDIVLAKFNYSKLDLLGNNVRIRLNSTVATVRNPFNEKVDIGYFDRSKKMHRIQAKHVVMACFNMMIPYIVRDIPKEQRRALDRNVKSCNVYSKVVIRNWKPFVKLGVHEIYCPKMPYTRIKLDYPVKMGGYMHSQNPDEPMCLHMVYVPLSSKKEGKDARSQSKHARSKLLHLHFSDLEAAIRQQLQQILGPAGFDHNKDILGITVNRWGHGYSYYFNSLFDDHTESEQIKKLACTPIGNVTIANSDSAWSAYLHSAIDMGYRAVGELS